MIEEFCSIERNGTWSLVTLPNNYKPLGLKWAFKVKRNSNEEVIRHKARLVVKAYAQRNRIDYEEVFTHVARIETIWILLAISTQNGWCVHHLDVKLAFLNSKVEKTIFVKQPKGLVRTREEDKVYRLKKVLYGLKQAPRVWYNKLDKSFKYLDFNISNFKSIVYMKHLQQATILLGVYVDNLLITRSTMEIIEDFKDKMKSLFKMSDLGLLTSYLRIQEYQSNEKIVLSQKIFALKILKQFSMLDYNLFSNTIESETLF